MTFFGPAHVSVSLTVLMAAALIAIPTGATHGQKAARSKGTTPAAAAPDLAADLDAAIRVVEAGDYQKFLERYAPVEVLRRLRQQDELAKTSRLMSQDAAFSARLLGGLKVLRKLTPQYDQSRGLATFEFDLTASNVPEPALDLHLPDTAGLKLRGLGDDLPTVINKAVELLEAGEIAAFVENLFPATELARLQADDQMPALSQQFKETPELQKSMLADLKRLQTTKGSLTEQGQVAEFQLAAAKGQPARTIKLQKGIGGWRLFDDAPRVTAELVRQSKQKPRGSVTRLQMELVGGNWRLVELP